MCVAHYTTESGTLKTNLVCVYCYTLHACQLSDHRCYVILLLQENDVSIGSLLGMCVKSYMCSSYTTYCICRLECVYRVLGVVYMYVAFTLSTIHLYCIATIHYALFTLCLYCNIYIATIHYALFSDFLVSPEKERNRVTAPSEVALSHVSSKIE